MRKFRPTLAAVAVALAVAAGERVRAVHDAYIFGDSLSDAGQYGARFTTNPGLTSRCTCAALRHHVDAVVHRAAPTTGKAARASTRRRRRFRRSAPNLSIAQQVHRTFLATGPLDPNALYQIQGGANDILVLAARPQAARSRRRSCRRASRRPPSISPRRPRGCRPRARATSSSTTCPTSGRRPRRRAGAQATFTALASLFNSTLNAGSRRAGLQVIQVNTFSCCRRSSPIRRRSASPTSTTPACTTASSLNARRRRSSPRNAALTYVFADGVHPTTGAALIVRAGGDLDDRRPPQMSLLAEAPLAVEDANFRTLDARMMSGINSPRPMSKYEMWVAYDYSNNDIKSTFGFGDADVNTLTAGGDIKLSEKLIAGAMVGYSENKGDFGGSAGNYKLKETSATFYMGYGDGPWYVGGTLGVGDLDYSVQRNIQLSNT